jgi:hypothetical protein
LKCLDDREALSANARRTAESYSMETVGKKMVSLYEDVVDRRKTP